jgi:adenylosuccinate lyase
MMGGVSESAPPDHYVSPLAERNASAAMQEVFSAQRKFRMWRRLWLALAEAQQELGLQITDEQLTAMREHLDDIDLEAAAAHEWALRHDVMAHVHAFGDVAPAARPVLHLGATSQFVNCNTELLQLRDGLRLVAEKTASVIDALGRFAAQYRATPTLGLTHLQPAQPTTVGKRAAQWAHDLALGLEEIEHRLAALRFRGVKGTTGTQASFLELFEGDAEKVERLDARVTEKMGWDPAMRFGLTGQTYPRVVDGMTGAALASVATGCARFATDLRLLASRREVEEPFGRNQVGSSAMAHKRNPMRAERVCGLSRLVTGWVQTLYTTAAEQWMERTLDDSATRRVALPEPFLALDGALDLCRNVAEGLEVHEKVVERNLRAELPFLATEPLLMAAAQQGADRQAVHEALRQHSQRAAQRMKEEGADNDLLERLRAEPLLKDVNVEAQLEPQRFVGRAPELVDRFLEDMVEPIRARYRDRLGASEEPRV